MTVMAKTNDRVIYERPAQSTLVEVYTKTPGCATWLLTLREERMLRVFENRLLRRVFGLRETR